MGHVSRQVLRGVEFTYHPAAGRVADLPAGRIGSARVGSRSAGLTLDLLDRGAEGRGGQGKSGDDDPHHFIGLLLYGNGGQAINK